MGVSRGNDVECHGWMDNVFFTEERGGSVKVMMGRMEGNVTGIREMK